MPPKKKRRVTLAVLIAYGLQPLTRNRVTLAVLGAWLAGWIVLAYKGYWMLAP